MEAPAALPAPIAIDYTSALTQGAGIGRYTRELVRALAALDPASDYRLFAAATPSTDPPSLPGGNFTWRRAPFTDAWLARLWHRAR
ncbi:MAG: glycosyltransferase family 4 protein, partial [Gammaproteobacteria bacterium]|nr:glycosyltransferase family 4 protein [Gammaproteobacteria bacterium]